MDSQLLEQIRQAVHDKKHVKVCEDERGVIWHVEVDGKEYSLIKTVKAEIRGGYFHQSKLHDYVLKGRVLWIEKVCLDCPEGHGENMTVLQTGDEQVTDANVPHMMVSFDETVVLEWLEEPCEAQVYKPFRDKVEAPQT